MTWLTPGQPLLPRALIGHQAEEAALAHALEELRAGRGGVLALAGEQGVGKSRLLREIDAQAVRAGFLVLRGRAVPEGCTPYRPLAEAFAELINQAATGSAPASAQAGMRALAPHLIPEAARWLKPTPLIVAEALRRMLAARPDPERGVLVLLEDLHWADPETLEAFEQLAETARGDRLLLVTALRDDESSRALAMLRRMQARRAVQIMPVNRLGTADVVALIADVLGASSPPDLIRAVEPADGLPFLVEEILSALAISGALRASAAGWEVVGDVRVVPVVVVDLVRDRVAGLSRSARRLLEAAAVVGDLRDGLAAVAAGLPPDDADAATAELVDAGLLREEHGLLGFRHALVRQAVLDLEPTDRAAALARAALAELEAIDPALSRTRLDRAIELAGLAGDAAVTARLLTVAGRRSLAAGALASAEEALRAARHVAPFRLRIEVDEALTSVLAEAGRVEDCLEIGVALLHALEVTGAGCERLLATEVRMARVAVAGGRDAERHLTAAALLLPRVDDRTRYDAMRALDLLRAESALAAGDLVTAAAAGRLAADGPPDVSSAAWLVLGRCARSSDLEAARGAFTRALAVAEAAELPVERLRALGELGTVDLLTAGPRVRLEQALRLALDSGALAAAVGIETQLAWWWEDRGSGADVIRHAVASAELAERLRAPVAAALAHAAAGVGWALSGDRQAAERSLAVAMAGADEHPDVLSAAEGHGLALLALRDDDRELALSHLRRATARLAGRPHPPPMPMWGLWALLEAVAGGGEDAVAQVRALGMDVHVMIRGYLHLAEAALLGRRGDGQAALREVAAGQWRLAGLQPFHALAMRHVAEAALEDGWGRPVAWLTDTLPELDQRGFTGPSSASRALLRHAGMTPPRDRSGVPAAWGVLGVTPREAEVLALLGAGEPTRSIAQQLYVSVKTVERHTANLAAKVGVSGRAQLVAFASRSLSQHGGSPDVPHLPTQRG